MSKTKSFQIRPIELTDNSSVAHIIRTVMTEFECVGEGYSINDPEVDAMFEAYDKENEMFYVIENESTKKLLGCGGIAHLKDAEPNVCELQKMYFLNELRGYGMGSRLLEICLSMAKELGYSKCYLETTKRMTSANKLYQKNGFKPLNASEGNTGHCACDSFYMLELKTEMPFSMLLNEK